MGCQRLHMLLCVKQMATAQSTTTAPPAMSNIWSGLCSIICTWHELRGCGGQSLCVSTAEVSLSMTCWASLCPKNGMRCKMPRWAVLKEEQVATCCEGLEQVPVTTCGLSRLWSVIKPSALRVTCAAHGTCYAGLREQPACGTCCRGLMVERALCTTTPVAAVCYTIAHTVMIFGRPSVRPVTTQPRKSQPR